MSERKETEFGHIPTGWEILSVGQLIEEGIIDKPLDGNHGEIHPKGTDFVSSGIPFVMATDINCGKVDLDGCKFITKEQADSLSKGFSISGDVLLTHKASLGRTAIVGDIKTPYIMLTPQVTYYRVKDKNKLSNKYLKYFFDAPVFQDTLVNHGDSGSTRAYIGITAQRDLPIIVPPIEVQKSIASILSNLDDKIDLLHRQNKSLEAMAETLFRRWFVEGAGDWEERPLSYFGEIVCGKTPSKGDARYFNGDVPFIKIPDMHGNAFIFKTTDSLTTEGKDSQPKKTLPAKSICVSCIATVGLVSMNVIESQTNQQINAIIPNKDYYRYFLYLFMKSSNDLLHALASGGTATLNLNTGNFAKIDLPFPSVDVFKGFNGVVEPLFNKIYANQLQVVSLEKLRDDLLPKLMSGEVRV